ncbi:MAG: VPLPA-CTERM sorting domain-containing protein [Gammaproteobacteria bacterium]
MKIIAIRIALFSLTLLTAGPVSALTYNWVDWTTTTSASGAAVVSGNSTSEGETIDVTYTGNINFVQLGSGTDYYAPSSPYTDNDTIDNRPPPAEMISIVGGPASLTHTVVFSEPVVNPVMAIVSLGRPNTTVTYEFIDEVFTILSSGTGFWGGDANESLFQLTPSVLTGVEGHGVIQFSGVYSSISWEVPTGENWHGFTFGFESIAPVPVPAALPLMMMALGVLGIFRRKPE